MTGLTRKNHFHPYLMTHYKTIQSTETHREGYICIKFPRSKAICVLLHLRATNCNGNNNINNMYCLNSCLYIISSSICSYAKLYAHLIIINLVVVVVPTHFCFPPFIYSYVVFQIPWRNPRALSYLCVCVVICRSRRMI